MSAPLDIRSCIRKSRGCAASRRSLNLYTSKFRTTHDKDVYLRSVIAANEFASLTDSRCFLTDRNSIFYRSELRVNSGLVDLSSRCASSTSSRNCSSDRCTLKMKHTHTYTYVVYTSTEHGHDFVKDPWTVGFSSEKMITRDMSCPVLQFEYHDSVNQTERRTLELRLCKIKLVSCSPDTSNYLRYDRTCARHVSW